MRNVAVGTTKKSTETRSKTWFWRNVRQVCEGDFGRRGRSRATVRCDTSKPSLRSSPWMRGAPQRGLASAIVRTSSATSEPTDGRPVRPRRDLQVQKARKPCRCQRITVSGRTTWSASRHPAHRLEQGELLAERQVLQREIGMAPERSTGGAQESEYEGHCAQRRSAPFRRPVSRSSFGKRHLPVPANHGLGANEVERLAPPRPPVGEPHP